ncbi:MAG: hypothetical protein DMF84_17115 [Acidobacteria bacterium]|nr:MAG: hypothetical protein DMF84_17115 [Acidobacteriota bacterium]
MDPSTMRRNSVRGIRFACTFTPSAYSDSCDNSVFLSSIVMSTRSISDFVQTVSCARLPQRIAARTEWSALT